MTTDICCKLNLFVNNGFSFFSLSSLQVRKWNFAQSLVKMTDIL